MASRVGGVILVDHMPTWGWVSSSWRPWRWSSTEKIWRVKRGEEAIIGAMVGGKWEWVLSERFFWGYRWMVGMKLIIKLSTTSSYISWVIHAGESLNHVSNPIDKLPSCSVEEDPLLGWNIK